MRITTDTIVIQKKAPGHAEESIMARATVRTKMITSMKRLQTIRLVKLPLKKITIKIPYHFSVELFCLKLSIKISGEHHLKIDSVINS